MYCHTFVGFFVLISVEIVTGEHFIVNNERTYWNGTPCILGVPNLVYSAETGWRVDISQLQTTHYDEVWIGYIEATFVFQYLGCTDVPQILSENISLVHNAGECYLACRGLFGIQKADSTLKTRIRCWCVHQVTYRLNKMECADTCENPLLVCGKQQSSYFSVYIKHQNDIPISGDLLQNNDHCLLFKPPQTYLWKECDSTKFYRVLCRHLINGNWTAIRQADHRGYWYQANSYCFDHGLFPATIESIHNAYFSEAETENHWTSYIRISVVIKANIQGLQLEANHYQYAYMSPGGNVTFTENGQRRSLCEDASTTNPMHEGPFTSVTKMSSSEETYTEPQHKAGDSAVTIGISVSIGVIVVLTVTIVFILLKRRGLLPCVKQRGSNKASDKLEGKASNQDSKGDNDVVNNYVLPEECVQKTTVTVDHSGHCNSACDEKEPEGDHDYVVNDKQEPFEDGINVSANYNYTRVVKANKRVTTNPDNIYNKLSVDHHSDYDHLGNHRQDQTVCMETSDEYNTTAVVLTVKKGYRGDTSAYNQVKYNRNKPRANGNDICDNVNADYDVTHQVKFKLESEDMSGYAHVSKDG